MTLQHEFTFDTRPRRRRRTDSPTYAQRLAAWEKFDHDYPKLRGEEESDD